MRDQLADYLVPAIEALRAGPWSRSGSADVTAPGAIRLYQSPEGNPSVRERLKEALWFHATGLRPHFRFQQGLSLHVFADRGSEDMVRDQLADYLVSALRALHVEQPNDAARNHLTNSKERD